MVNLYITSKESTGKTALCAGIGRKLSSQGRKVGYFSPVRVSEASGDYRDAAFMREVLELEESPDILAPLSLSNRDLWKSLIDNREDFIQQVKQNHARVSKGKDIVIMEGLNGFSVDSISTLACYTIAEALDARVIVVLPYSSRLVPSDIARAAEELGQKLLGVIVNFVPEPQIEAFKQRATDSFQRAGIKVLGVLPEVRSLLGISVKEIAEAVGGEIMTSPENTDEIVENLMLGAMSLDSGIDYFSRKTDKAAIIRGERPDMQLAALQTSTKCLVITSATKPLATVVSEAESKHIPLVVAPKDTAATIADIERNLAHSSFHSARKLKKLEELLERYLDFKSLASALGL